MHMQNNGVRNSSDKSLLTALLANIPDIELAVLIGSRAQGVAQRGSDWDIALRWDRHIAPLERLGRTETLRRMLARSLEVAEDKIDLIDLATARLAMRAVAAEEGVVLKGEDSLAWSHFLLRTWRDLEDFYWEQAHAT
jgi:predicted nucleotidyltransferase